jgi:hypothetical protein
MFVTGGYKKEGGFFPLFFVARFAKIS